MRSAMVARIRQYLARRTGLRVPLPFTSYVQTLPSSPPLSKNRLSLSACCHHLIDYSRFTSRVAHTGSYRLIFVALYAAPFFDYKWPLPAVAPDSNRGSPTLSWLLLYTRIVGFAPQRYLLVATLHSPIRITSRHPSDYSRVSSGGPTPAPIG